MLPDNQQGNTKILYYFNCLLDGMHTNLPSGVRLFRLPRQLGKSGFMPKAALEFVMH